MTRPVVLAPSVLLIGIAIGYAVAILLSGQYGGSATASAGLDPHAVTANPASDYAAAVRAAAVKRPEYQHKLLTIDPASAVVQVVNFHDDRELPPKDRKFDVWVSLPEQLRTACAGSADPVQTLKEVLGLPPDAKYSQVTAIEVSPKDLFRPCLSEAGIGDQQCALAMPAAIKAGDIEELKKFESAFVQGNATAGSPMQFKEAIDSLKILRAEYDRLYFLTNQMWTSYQQTADRNGYPFTGMGWTYNWGSRAADHVGVSEFVIRRDAEIRIVSNATPAEFCQQRDAR